MLVIVFDDLGGRLEVPKVIQRIEYPEDVHAIVNGTLYECFYHIIGIVAIAHYVLAPEEHRKRRFGHVLFQRPEPLPGIFPQKAVHYVKSGSSPNLQGIVAYVVQHFGYREHIFGAAPGGKKALMAIP
jgi:hypothetical protein